MSKDLSNREINGKEIYLFGYRINFSLYINDNLCSWQLSSSPETTANVQMCITSLTPRRDIQMFSYLFYITENYLNSMIIRKYDMIDIGWVFL